MIICYLKLLQFLLQSFVTNCWPLISFNWKEKILFNKISLGVGIMCMEDILILQEYDIEVMGRKKLIFYEKLIL
jgi:hypothetical protein